MAWLWNLWKVREGSDVAEGAEKGELDRGRGRGLAARGGGSGGGCCKVGGGVGDRSEGARERWGANGGTVISLLKSNL